MIIGIDATNLRQGGGITHLVEMLRAAEPGDHGIERVIVWGGNRILSAIEDRPWLLKVRPVELDEGFVKRTWWQWRKLSKAAREAGCTLVFIPGGSYSGTFRPVVTMSRNLLPFEWKEFSRFGWSWLTIKNVILRWTQSKTFRKTDGLIFLTRYAEQCVMNVVGDINGITAIIPHGLNARFQIAPRAQRDISEYGSSQPYRLIYVSIIDEYKHQWNVVQAVSVLRQAGYPLMLDLIGPAYPPALVRLKEALDSLDPDGEWASYLGAIPYKELHQKYAQADLGIFASTCENMPNILLETMAAGLPIACSNFGPMPEVLGSAGVYFDPEDPNEIARAIRTLLDSPSSRAEKADEAFKSAAKYSWAECSNSTFAFLAQVCRARGNVTI